MAGRVSCVYAYLSTSILSPNFNSTEQLMFLQKSEYLTTALFRNTMLRTTTKQSYQDSCSCRCRKNSFAGHTLKQKVEKPRESTVASMHYRVLSIVANAEIFSEEWHGRPGVHHTTNGDVPAELKRVQSPGCRSVPDHLP